MQVDDLIFLFFSELNTNTNEITPFSKVNGLSETGITQIVGSDHTTLSCYNSSNIDLIKDGEIINMSAILNSTLIGDKTINELYACDQFVFVCTGFGIVVIDWNKAFNWSKQHSIEGERHSRFYGFYFCINRLRYSCCQSEL